MTSAPGPALSGGVPPLFSLEPWGPVFPFLQPEGSGSFLRGRARAAHAGQVQAAASEPRRCEQELGAGAWGPSSVHVPTASLPGRLPHRERRGWPRKQASLIEMALGKGSQIRGSANSVVEATPKTHHEGQVLIGPAERKPASWCSK